MVPPPDPLAGHVFPTSQRFQSFGYSVIYSWLYLPPTYRYEGAQFSFLKAWFPDCQLHTTLANCCTPKESNVWSGGLMAGVKPSTVSNPIWEGNLGGSSSHLSLTTYSHTERLGEFILFFFSIPRPWLYLIFSRGNKQALLPFSVPDPNTIWYTYPPFPAA